MNKRYFYNNRKSLTIPMLSLLLVAGSCKKFTELQPNNSFAETTAYTSPERVALDVTGVYSAAQSSPYTDGSNRGYPFGSANTEQNDARGEDVIAVPSFYLITYEGSYDATTANNTAMWTSLYATINRANVVIDGLKGAVSSGVITQAAATAYEAECRFIRALSYHELLVQFARPYNATTGATHLGVPLQLTAVTSPATVDVAKTQKRNTVAECYTQVLADLDFAETNLPATRTGGLKVTRATKGAAVGLKTRVKLHMGDYAGVIAEGAKLGTNALVGPFTAPATYGGYALTASPDGPFASVGSNTANSESMFSIEHSTTRNAGTNGSISTMYSKSPGRALIAISPIIWNASFWRADDLRRSLLATNDGRSYFTTKYKDPVTWTDANPIIRYAEVLLNVAEAYARTSPLSPNALALLNAVRNRAVTTVANQYTLASFASPNALTQAILNERRIEFLCEGKRYADIHRLATDATFGFGGIPSKASYTAATFSTYTIGTDFPASSRTVPAIPYDNFKFVWPIPSVETSANPVLAAQQNPGY